jgi:1,4-alpha-glucan branching enzyme
MNKKKLDLKKLSPFKPENSRPMNTDKKVDPTARSSADRTEFLMYAPEAKTVSVAGTFNNWRVDANPLTRDPDGTWRTSLALAPGRYEYKFIIDGKWCCEPGADGIYDGRGGCVCNEFGTMNRVLEVT